MRRNNNNNNNCSFIFTADNLQLLHNNLPCRTAQRTSYNITKHNIQGLAWEVGSYKPAPRFATMP